MATNVTDTQAAKLVCTGGGSHNWFFCNFTCKIEPNANQTKYLITISGEWWNTGRLDWNGDCALRATFYSSDSPSAQTKSVDLQTPIYGTGARYNIGTLQFETGSAADKSITLNIDFDLTPTTGTNGSPGIYHVSDRGNITHFIKNDWVFDLAEISLGNKPSTPTLTNNNTYNGNSSISASANSLTIGVSSSDWGSPESGKIMWSCSNGSGGELDKTSQFSVPNLNHGTTYTVTVYLKNSIGSSESATITIRTRYKTPAIQAKIKQKKLEGFVISWTSDINLKQIRYKVDSGGWKSINVSSNYGQFDISNLQPKTWYNLQIQGTSDNSHDAVDSNVVNITDQTLDIARISSIGNMIFSQDFIININSSVSNKLVLRIWSAYNGNSFSTDINVSAGANTINFGQNDLDRIYKTYPQSNNNPLHFQLITKGSIDYKDDEKQQNMVLTGIAKTAHTGISNNTRRVQVWIGDQSQRAKRAVTWTGISNNPRRTI